MASLREYILSQSTLPTGSTIREHLENPISAGTGGGGDVYIGQSLEATVVTATSAHVLCEIREASITVTTGTAEIITITEVA